MSTERKTSEQKIIDLQTAIKENDVDTINKICSQYNNQGLMITLKKAFLDFKNTKKYKQSVEYIMTHFLDDSLYIRIAKNILQKNIEENIGFPLYILSTRDLLTSEYVLETYLSSSKNGDTRQTLKNVYSVIKTVLDKEKERLDKETIDVKDIDAKLEDKQQAEQEEKERLEKEQAYKYRLYSYISIILTIPSQKAITRSPENKQIFLNTIDTILDSKDAYQFFNMLFRIVYNLWSVDDEGLVLLKLLQNYYKYRHDKEDFKDNIVELFRKTLPYINTLYIDIFSEFFSEHNIEVSMKDIIDSLNESFANQHIDNIVNTLKYIHKNIQLKQTQVPLSRSVSEQKRTGSDIQEYTHLFKKLDNIAYEYQKENKIYLAILLSIPLDIIEKYMDELVIKKISYADVLKIFYLNYYSLSETNHLLQKLKLNKDYTYKLFYKKLQDITGVNYSSYKIEKDSVVNLFDTFNYGISSLIEEYADRK